jgi:alpha-L-glutamate ligase-like protein
MKLGLTSLNRHSSKVFALLFLIILIVRVPPLEEVANQLKPKLLYHFNLVMTFEKNQEVSITTFLPQHDERQIILNEQILSNGLDFTVNESAEGMVANWVGEHSAGQIAYRYTLLTQGLQYTIDPVVAIPDNYGNTLSQFLMKTKNIQVDHPDVSELWQQIHPSDSSLLATVRTIYGYTYNQLKTMPFKGMTDALTALRLRAASCNGKSRLFIALARKNNIPARLVGGVIMNGKTKKTSHQWVELYIQNQWIPFDPTNGHFASLPQNYLELYRGDHSLFKRSVDINFDYLFSSREEIIAPALYLHQNESGNYIGDKDDTGNNERASSNQDIPDKLTIDITSILLSIGVQPKAIGLILLFPLCTLLITFFRNVVGIKTFGIFLPMLVAGASIFTGLFYGLVAFTFILITSLISHHYLHKLKLLKIPRLAAIITVNTLFFILGLFLLKQEHRFEFGMLALFPIIIISFVAEKIHKISEEGDWQELFIQSGGSIFAIASCYFLLGSFVLQGVFSFYPETFFLVLAAQIFIGQWTGIRISELIRFRGIFSDSDNPVMGINSRNIELVLSKNDPALLLLAADKLATKKVLETSNIATPKTLLVFNNMSEVNRISFTDFESFPAGFALKPNKGSQGNGILIIRKVANRKFYDVDGNLLSLTDIRQHIAEIVSGSFAQHGQEDKAYVEPLILQHDSLIKLCDYGLADIRVIVIDGAIVSAMLRLPTKRSSGKANLHQGAIGIGLEIANGKMLTATTNGKPITHHPDNNQLLIGTELMYWTQICELSIQVYKAIPLGYAGIDICIDRELGPLVLEVNGRPGIEIQNVRGRGMYRNVSQ